nr:single-stranded-DNA-specific exonuclease RecJ [Thauera sp.]
AFEEVVSELLEPAQLERRIETDGQLEPGYFTLDAVRMLDNEIWGQGFPAPVFDDVFRVERQRVLKDKHLKLELSRGGARFEAIQFNHADGAGAQIHAAYRLSVNDYKGVCSVQLMLEHFETA